MTKKQFLKHCHQGHRHFVHRSDVVEHALREALFPLLRLQCSGEFWLPRGLNVSMQGMLTEGESSVQLNSSLR
jgi:hypothetical protein